MLRGKGRTAIRRIARRAAATKPAILELIVENYGSLPFDDAAATSYATLRTELERLGKPIGANDMMIAAIALANGACW